jgi:hypothetical protein
MMPGVEGNEISEGCKQKDLLASAANIMHDDGRCVPWQGEGGAIQASKDGHPFVFLPHQDGKGQC